MKILKTIFFLFAVGGLLTFIGCSKESDLESAKGLAMKNLISKMWTVNSLVVPPGTATDESEWQSFTVKFTETTMTTAGYPTGSSAVWPSGAYTLSAEGKVITRADGVVMTVITLNETAFTTTFMVSSGTHVGGRIAELGGDFTFNMK